MRQLTAPAGWALTTLGEVCDIVGGATPDTADASMWGQDVAWLTPADLATNRSMYVSAGSRGLSQRGFEVSSTRMLPVGAVLFSSRAPIGHVAIAAGPVCTNQGFKSLVAPDGVVPKYLYWYMKWATPLIREAASGTTFAEVSGKVMRVVPLLLPPIEEQARIAEVLERQEQLHDHLSSQLKVLRDRLTLLRRSLIGAGLAGQLTLRGGDDASQVVEDARHARRSAMEVLSGRAIRRYEEPDGPQNQPQQALPAGWTWVAWRQVGVAQNGTAFPSHDYAEQGTRLLRPGNLDVGGGVRWDASRTRFMPVSYAETHKRFLVGENELVMNLTAQSLKDEFLGRVCHTRDGDECLLNQRIARLVPLGLDTKFMYWLFKSPQFRRFVDGLNAGSLIQHMFTTQLDEYCFALPPLAEQRAIGARLDKLVGELALLDAGVVRIEAKLEASTRAHLNAAFTGALGTSRPEDMPVEELLRRIELHRTRPATVGPRSPRTVRTRRAAGAVASVQETA